MSNSSDDTLSKLPSVETMSDAERVALYASLLSDKELAELPTEKILEIRKKLNPYGRTIAGSNKYLNFSVTQITHEYWKKFITTSMIGFLNRMCDEWKVPAGVPVVSVYKYLEDPTSLDTPQHAIEKNNDRLTNLEAVVMVSTDKACEPTNVYGMAKALAESAIVEKSLYIKNRKFVNIRYGNVLNSRGSIIPILHEKGHDPDVKEFTLTHEDMTRFVMTLEQSVELIEYAAIHGESGDTIIPKLISMKLIDLMEIFSEKYGKPIRVTGLRPGEKMLESLISETQAMRLEKKENGYMHIKPPYKNLLIREDVYNYNSKLNPLKKEEIFAFLNNLNFL